jgi:hypothetical protein
MPINRRPTIPILIVFDFSSVFGTLSLFPISPESPDSLYYRSICSPICSLLEAQNNRKKGKGQTSVQRKKPLSFPKGFPVSLTLRFLLRLWFWPSVGYRLESLHLSNRLRLRRTNQIFQTHRTNPVQEIRLLGCHCLNHFSQWSGKDSIVYIRTKQWEEKPMPPRLLLALGQCNKCRRKVKQYADGCSNEPEK